MSFPTKNDRQKCWDAKDRLWECLDGNKNSEQACTKLRSIYESSCPGQWVKHFDRKRQYLLFKDQVEKDGSNSLPVQETDVLQNRDRYIPPYKRHVSTLLPYLKRLLKKLKQEYDMGVSEHSRSNLNQCYIYLTNLITKKSGGKFDLQYFENFVTSEKYFDDQSTVLDCCTILLRLLNKYEKQIQLNCDIACAFCSLLTTILENIHELYTTVLTIRRGLFHHVLLQSEETTSLLQQHSTVLVAGVVKYISRKNYVFSDRVYFSFIESIKENVYFLLTQVEEIYTLLYIADFFLTLVDQQPVTTCEILEDALNTVMSIVMNHWNHHVSEVRARVKNLLFTCLKLNYKDCLTRTENENAFAVAVNIRLFKSIALDIFWSVPYKYFAYLVGLEFIAEIYSLSKFLVYVQSDLREGFTRSLQTKRMIGSEADLFKYCTRNLSFIDWMEIFEPLIDFVISSNNREIATNFSHSWLPTILKQFPEFSLAIWPRFLQHPTPRSVAHSRLLLALLKVCHKQRIRLPVSDDRSKLLYFMQDCFTDAEDARGELFLLMCNLDEQSVVPSTQELALIMKFLRMNAHSSSTILRQQVFSAFTSLVLRLICSGLKVLKTKPKSAAPSILQPTLIFLNEFNDFVANCIRPGSSYQRRITALTLYRILMTYAVSNCGVDIRRNNLKDADKFVSFAAEQGHWHFTNYRLFDAVFRCLMDPCSEIQNVSFILLKTYFDLGALKEHSTLFQEALVLVRNNQFYKRQSGVVAVLSFVCLSYNTKNAVDMLNENGKYASFVELFLVTLRNQVKVLEMDTLNAALYEPLDATVRILTYLMADRSSPEFEGVSEVQIEQLIDLLEQIVPLLLKALFLEDITDYAPSFEESDLALQHIIEKSEITRRLSVQDTKEEEFQLKPLYQILLNFVWISLKTCCECESRLITCQMKRLSETSVIRCCNLIVRKLKLCRHKGVIEAAAIALSSVVKELTVREMCNGWLDSILQDIIFLIKYKSGASISRKSGGLSLLVQNIVGNDERKNKPLLTKCWTELRSILDVNYDEIKVIVSQELPQTHALHLLRVLISDTRNSVCLSNYFEEISILCMQTLNVPIWTVRNASLQLFGTILPKIVGQKNSQNDTGVRRSFEEVFTTMPQLLDYMLLYFNTCNEGTSHKLISHSNLVPSLVLLSNIQVGIVNLMQTSLRAKLLHLRVYIKSLLGSDLYYVRKLAAKTFISLHSREEISVFARISEDVVISSAKLCRNENFLHGQLLVLKYALLQHAHMKNFPKYLQFTSEIPQASFMCETLLYELGIKRTSQLAYIRHVLKKLPTHRYLSMGYSDWMLSLLGMTLRRHNSASVFGDCLSDTDLNLVESCLRAAVPSCWISQAEKSFIFNILSSRMETYLKSVDGNDNVISILKQIFKVLLALPRYEVSAPEDVVERNHDLLLHLNRHYFRAMNLQVLSLFMAITRNVKRVSEVLNELQATLDVTQCNRNLRLHAGQAMLLLTDLVVNFAEPQKKVVWTILVDLVLDEEEDIRAVGRMCVETFTKSIYGSTDEVLTDLFASDFMLKWFSEATCIEIMKDQLGCDDIGCVAENVGVPAQKFKLNYSNDEIQNPFDQGVNNAYKEELQVIERSGKVLNYLIPDVDGKYFMEPANIRQIMENCAEVVQNKLFITGRGYEIGLTAYYILTAILKIRKSHAKSLQLIEFETIAECCLNFKNTFYLQDDISV